MATLRNWLKLRYCEKATCFDDYSVVAKQAGDFFHIFEAFSENLKSTVFVKGNHETVISTILLLPMTEAQ